MPDKKYLIEIPGMPEGTGIWEAEKWERNKDAFMAENPDAHVYELGEYDPEDSDEHDQIMLTFEGDAESSGVWDLAKWERNKDAFTAENPGVRVQRVRYHDYWGERATANREQRAQLLLPDADRNARLAELGYYDDLSEGQIEFSMDSNLGFGLKPLSSAIETSVVTGETRYLDPTVQEFFANDSAYTDRMAEIARLDAEYESNPSVIAQREWEAQQRAEQAKYIDSQLAAINAEVEEIDAHRASVGAMGNSMDDFAMASLAFGAKGSVDAALEDDKLQTYRSAAKLYEKAKQANEIAGKGFWGAVGDVAMDKLRDLVTQSDIQMYNQIGDILTRLESQYGSLENLTDEQIESGLSKAEQALIRGFFAYNEAMEAAGQDMSSAYKGGKIFGESISFMLEFLATGGLAKGTGKAAGNVVSKGLLRWARKAAAGTAKRTARAFTARAARGLTSALVGTAARTIAAPGTYGRMAEESVKIEDGHLHRGMNAFMGFVDAYIENLSEISGGVIGKTLKIAGVNPAKMLGKISFGKIGQLLADNRLAQEIAKLGKNIFGEQGLLKKFGFNGIFEEVEEEYIGNLIRELTIQDGALAEMHKDGNFGAMLIGFAPMTLFGAGISAVQMGAANIEAANLGKKLRETLGYHYSEEQINHMMNLVEKAENGEQVAQAINTLEGLNQEEAQQLWQYGAFMAQNKAMLFARKAQDDSLAQAKRAEYQQQFGNFWQTSEDGAESVQVAELRDGRTVFVTSAPNESGMITIIDAETGRQGFSNVSEYAEQQDKEGNISQKTRTWAMDAFLESRIASERLTAQEARMSREYNEQVQNLQSQITSGTKINLGTTGNPIWMVATGQTSKDGVFAVDSTGATHTIGWMQVADAMKQPIRVKTDQEIIDEEVAAVVARNAERRKKMRNATPAMMDAVNESAAQTAEVVAQENKHIPMNEDGTVNEAAFWEQDPEGYVQWNDEQNQDGGADSLQQVAITKAVLTSLLAEAQQAQQTSNPAERKAAKLRAQEIAEKIDRLTAIEASYAEQRIAPLRERALRWKSLTNAPVYIIETEEELASISGQAAESNKGGARVRGFAKDGRAYIYLPGIVEESEIDAVFMHEAVAHTGLKGMLGQQAFDQLCDQVWEMMSPEARQVFIDYPGVNGDKRAAADEYIAHIAERMGSGVAIAEEKTIWQKVVDFVRNVLRAMGIDINISESELADILQMAYKDLAENMAEAEKIVAQQQKARVAAQNAPSTARQEYDTYAEDLTHDEIRAVAENDFTAAQQAYDALVDSAPRVEAGESAKDFIARKKAYNEQVAEAKAALDARQALMDEIAKIDAENAPVLTDTKALEQEMMFSARLTEGEVDSLVEAMKANAEVAEVLDLTPENWEAQFGAEGIIETPVGEVKMGPNQVTKLFARKRVEYFGMIKPTLTRPDVIVEKYAPAEDAERDTKYVFIKSFVKPDGSRIVHFESVTVQKEGREVSISSHEAEEKDIKKEMQNGMILHLNDMLSLSSEGSLTEAPIKERPDLVPTSDNVASDSKDSENLEIPSDSARFSVITPEMDAEYLAAVERGDMETAQRMVLEAAKLAMPNTKVVDEKGNPKVVYHGTKGKFNTFAYSREDIGFHFGTKGTARTRIGRGKDARIMQVFLNLENPLIFDTDLGSWDADYIVKDLLEKEMMSYDDAKAILLTPNGYKRNSVSALVDLRQWMSNNGYDGIVYPNWYESNGKDSYIAFNRNQIKSADPVTYDDAGNVIPLSERFNPEKSDIRFSVLDTSKAELKDKPIKLNGMHRFKVKSAFKGVKGADGSFPYLKAEIIEVSEGYNGPAFTFDGTLEGFAVIYVPKGTISEGQKDNEFFIDPKAIESQLWDILKSAENYYEFKYAKGPYAHGGNWLNAEGNVFFSVGRGSLVGMHNISEEKLRKVIKQGGSANPSTAVIDIERQAFDSYGEISLIMPSSLVDAETGRNAGTFTADAWTPTYPQIEKRFSVDELQRAYWRDITAIPEEMQHEVRMAFDSWLDNRTASGLAYMFLQERGEAPEMVRVAAKFPQEIKDKMSAILGEGRTSFRELTDEEKQAVLDLYIQENFGGSREDFDSSIAETIQRIEDRLSTGKVPSFVEKRITADLQWMKEHGYNYDNISDFVRNIVSDIRHAGEVNTAATTNRALDYIKDNNLSAEYEQWKESLNNRYGIKEYLFDGFTPSGNPRWLPNTVENASKLMNKQGLAGATGMVSSFNRFVATLAPKKKSLSDIRSSKERLVEDEKLVDDFRDKWSEVFFDLGIKCQPDAKGYEDYGLERLTEAAQKKNPGAYLKKEYGVELSQEDLQRLADMIKAIKTEFPARYFETKFQRPVYLNEFAAAVIPTTTSEHIKQAIAEAGLPIFEYDSSADGARREATLKATDIEGVRFSVFEPHNATMDEIDSLFHDYNGDKSLEPLYDKVSALAHTMGLQIRFDYPWSEAAGSTFGDKVKFNTEFFNSLAYKSQDKAHALLHEMIHATTNYAIAARNTGALTEGMKEAVSQLESIYGEIVNDRSFDGTYGARSVYEMVAELSNPDFRNLLKEKNLFQRILDAIKRLLGIEVGENALDNLSATLDYMLDNYDGRVFGAVVNQYQKHQEYTRFSAVQIDPAVRQEMDTIKAKAMWDGTFMKAPNGADTKLTEEQWLMVRTKNFIDWFGDWINDPANASKIVDENGEPMVMVHGSPNKFTIFRRGKGPYGTSGRGMYFGRAPKDLASHTYGGENGYKYLVFLNVRNLFSAGQRYLDRSIITNDAGKRIPTEVMYEIIGTSSYEQFIESVTDVNGKRFESYKDIIKDISKEKYQKIHDSFDGKGMFLSKQNIVRRIFRKNKSYLTLDHNFIGEIVVRDPNQIKSAVETTGEFSESDDIRYSSRFDVNTNPTEAQKKAGNYKMGHLRLDGYNITIENPKGSVRRGTDSNGNEWENVLNNDYGYIRGTEGVDGDHIDVYLSDNPEEGNVFVVDQVRPDTGEFDEHKVMYGFSSIDEAREAYLANFSEGWSGLGTITEVTKDEFRKWIDSSHRKTKPFSEYKSVKANAVRFSAITPEMDAEYLAAVERGDMETAQRMVLEAAKLAGYDSNSDYQGSLAFNGAAPSGYAYYDTKEERIEAWENGDMEDDQTLGDYKDAGIDISNLGWSLTSPVAQRMGNEYTRESIKNLAEAVNSDSRKIKVYRAVDADIKEDSVRNGDWVTPSRAYAEYHIGLQDWKEGRIIEQEVDIDDIWWDGNDINEWGYNDGKGYAYKNTPNNRKLLAPVTYDDEGNVIPLSERFNPENPDIRFSAISTPTDNVVAEGMRLSIQDFARLAGNIFQDMPESFRKEAIEETFKRGWDMQSAIFQIPARLAEKENWDEADKNLAKVIREKVQDAMDESGVVMSRPLTTKEALWMLYRSTEANKDSMLDAAKRSIVAHNLGFDSRSMALKKKADDNIRYSVVRSGQIDAATDMYNYEASLWINRLKESWLDMNQSVIALQDALEKASGKPIASWENVVLALNQLSSKSYAEKKKYLRNFLMPLWDQIIEMTKVSGLSIEQIERYMMLKHGLERNKKFAMRDAKQFYREMYDKVADRMKNTSHAEQVVALSEANKRIADIDAQIATASGKKLKDLQEARARAVVEKEIAELVLRNDEQQNEADLQMYFNAIEAENNPKYAEFREKDYGGLTSMFMDQIADVKRIDYKTDEAYQAALLASVKPRFDKVADMEAEAQKEVDDYESKAYMPALWKLVNAATKETLRHQHAAGMITTEQYNAVRNMFDYYVPLRGFADNTAEDMYSYYMNNSAGGFAKPIIAAKGRKTRAESPLGWIGTMAESAIQQDNKNEVKMKLYYALINRPDTGVLSLSEMWYVYDHTDPTTGRKVFVPAYPPATDGVLTADQMRQHIDAWEQSMKAKQAIGEAYKREQGVNLGGSVIFQDKAQDAEHIIRIKVAGKDYAILVNGNPRAAQAINGLLNPDANVGPVRQWYGALRRGLSALMTSFSPLFWVSNYQRDLLSSFMRTSESEGWGQAFKYLGNRFHGWKAAKYIYAYDNGTIGDSYYENLYKEFAENGGITGYTSLTTNKEYEKLLADYAKNVDKEMLNWIKGVWDKFMGFGEAIEQVSRFAAYITARESGKSIEESVAAAKEVSVNFNRKGSASPISLGELEKLRDKNGKPLSMPKKAMAIVFSAMPSALKELYFFFNASIQALSSSAKLAKKSPGKAMAWAGMYMGLSVGLAFLNYLLAGDDDDNDYLDLPDYLRHSTALIKMGDNYYFKWSLPQEMRPFYATADILVSKIMGKTPHKTGKDVAWNIFLAAMEWLPVNPFGTEDPLLALVPDVAAPFIEIRENQNSFGGRIYNDMPFVSEDVARQIPAYRKGTSKTGEIYMDMAEFINDITGGDEVQKGIINLNPAMVEHLVEGYGGGIYDFGKMVIGIPGLIYDAVWGEGVEVRDIPFVNKILLSTDETNMYSHINEAFYHYEGVSENAKRVENEYRKSDDPSRADDYRNEEDWRIYLLFRQYEKDLEMAKEKVDNAADETEREVALQEQNAIREMLLQDIARGTQPDASYEIAVDLARIKAEANKKTKAGRDARAAANKAGRDPNVSPEEYFRLSDYADSLQSTAEYERNAELAKTARELEKQIEQLRSTPEGPEKDSLMEEIQRQYNMLLD